MNFSNLLSKMLVLFLFIAVGFGCGKGGMIDEHTRKKLNKLVLYLCSPALILHSVMNSELNYAISDILLLMLFALVYLLVLIVLAYVFVPAIRAKREDRGVFLFAGVFGNCIFMGFPVMSALYGERANVNR